MRRADLQARLSSARAQTDALFAVLRGDSVYDRPVPERHRLIFYLGHLEAFDWNHIGARGLGAGHVDAGLDLLFEAGIDPGSQSEHPQDAPADWPRLETVNDYARKTRACVDRVLGSASAADVEMALEHRLMHAETLAYLIHNLPVEKKQRAGESEPVVSRRELSHDMVEVAAGACTLGKRRGEDGFGWDNEFEEHVVDVPEFRIDRRKTTNGEYLEFVNAGGPAPFFWKRSGETWLLRCMFEEIALPLDWPVWATHAQASAYAAWKGKRLASEAEFHRAAYGSREGVERRFPWGDTEPGDGDAAREHGNFGFARWDPVPVDAFAAGDSAFGLAQTVGNGWEWTSSLFGPFPGFRPMDGYPGYSANFFDGEHFVLKGASPRTASCFLRRSFRNWFRPNYPYVYAGFRCVEK